MVAHRSTYLDESVPRVGVCQDCRTQAPTASTNYTVITSRYGWRLTHVTLSSGARRVEWRCPACWARYRDEVVRRPPAAAPVPN